MPADSDHIRRDALHAARSEVRIIISKYIRRLDAEAKAHIDNALATGEGELDGTAIGREAAAAAAANYLGIGNVSPAIEAEASAEEDEDADAVLRPRKSPLGLLVRRSNN